MDEKPILTADDARVLPRFRAGGELIDRHRMSRAQAAALAEGTADTSARDRRRERSVKAEPGDLRGIPVIGQGVGGVSPGTSPQSVINRLDRDRERRKAAELGPDEPMVAFA